MQYWWFTLQVLYLVLTRHITILRCDGKRNKKEIRDVTLFRIQLRILKVTKSSGHSISREANSSRTSQQIP
jgi:hypothetical protein